MSENENNIQQNVTDEEFSKSSQMSDKRRQVGRKTKFYYSFLTLILILCIIQIGVSTILNISKTISNKTKIKTMEHILDNAEAYNEHLKQEIKLFSTDSTLEGIARNNLKMAGEDEVLVIINESKEEVADKDLKEKNIENKPMKSDEKR